MENCPMACQHQAGFLFFENKSLLNRKLASDLLESIVVLVLTHSENYIKYAYFISQYTRFRTKSLPIKLTTDHNSHVHHNSQWTWMEHTVSAG